MTVVHTTAMNALFVPVIEDGEEKLAPSAEVVLIGTRPEYRIDAKGALVRDRAVEELRFVASVPVLRALAESLAGYADLLEGKVCGKVAVGPEREDGSPETQTPAV